VVLTTPDGSPGANLIRKTDELICSAAMFSTVDIKMWFVNQVTEPNTFAVWQHRAPAVAARDCVLIALL
jgi:hypothetical protein